MLLPISQLQAVFNFGAFHVTFPYVDKLAFLPIITVLSGMAWLYWKFFQSKFNDWEETIRFCVLSLIWFVVFNKVFSVQFLVWFLPLIRLINFGKRKQTPIDLLLIIISTMGTLIFPYGYYYYLSKRYILGALILIKCLLAIILFLSIWKSRKVSDINMRIEALDN